jgi:hypothetical protein
LEYKVKQVALNKSIWEPIESFRRGGMADVIDFEKRNYSNEEISLDGKKFILRMNRKVGASNYKRFKKGEGWNIGKS